MELSPLPKQQFLDNNGEPLVGGLLFTYVAGTSTKVDTYTDSTGGSLNTNPIVLDYRGECNLWLDTSKTYKFILSPRGDTDPPTKPIWSVDQISVPIGLVDITQQLIGSILWPQTSLEAATSTTPNTLYMVGDPRRAPAFYEDLGQVDYGDVPTYIDATHVSVPGDQTSRYVPFTRVMVIGSASRADVRVVSSSFAAGITTITVTTSDVGGTVPSPSLALWVERNSSTHGPGTIVFNSNSIAGQFIVNRANSTLTAARTSWITTDAAGVANAALNCVAVSPNYSGAYLANGFSSGGRAVIYTPPSYSLEIGTADQARILIPGNNNPIGFLNNVEIGPPNFISTRATLSLNGATDGMLEFKVASVQKGYAFGNASEIVIGSTTTIPLSFLYNGSRAIQINGTTTTGASTPTLSANKPGSNAGVIAWQPVLTSAGAQGYIPVLG